MTPPEAHYGYVVRVARGSDVVVAVTTAPSRRAILDRLKRFGGSVEVVTEAMTWAEARAWLETAA